MVRLLTKVGPDIDRISKLTGTHPETLRYWYKEKIIKSGMVVQAIPNEAALGLRRVAAKVRVPELFVPHIQPVFWAMSDLSYAVAFELAIPDDFYMLVATVPEEFVEDYKSFILRLTEMGLFESTELYEFDRFRRAPMRGDFYDFDERRWDYDWKSPVPIEQDEMQPPPTKRARFDKIDLLILKELQRDATKSLKEVNAAINSKHFELNYKTMNWHYQHHIVRQGLIDGYSVRWPGTKYNQSLDKPEHRQHRYLMLELVVREVTPNETLQLTGKAHQTPFLWSETVGKDYFAQFAFPLESMIEALEYLREVMHPFARRASHYFIDQKNSVVFAVPYNLWNNGDKKWTFEPGPTLARFENLVLKVKNGAGTA
ncbi:MAG: AsnC family protein [Nitrososphaerales archaeon]|jgi:hypothetical protein